MTQLKIPHVRPMYKRWGRTTRLFGDSLLAAKNSKNGESVQLLISGDKMKKELFSRNGKVVDLIDDDGVKRTYIYKRGNDGVFGQMILPKGMPADKAPLVSEARWVTKDLVPQEVELTVNPEHCDSSLYIRTMDSDDFNKSTFEHIARVKAEDFETTPKVTPKKITFETVTGEKIVSEGSWADNIRYANHFGITKEPLGENLMVFV